MEMEIELQRQCDLIRALRDRQDDSGKDSPKGPTTEAAAEGLSGSHAPDSREMGGQRPVDLQTVQVGEMGRRLQGQKVT